MGYAIRLKGELDFVPQAWDNCVFGLVELSSRLHRWWKNAREVPAHWEVVFFSDDPTDYNGVHFLADARWVYRNIAAVSHTSPKVSPRIRALVSK